MIIDYCFVIYDFTDFFNKYFQKAEVVKEPVTITPMSDAPQRQIEQYLGNINLFFIRESTSVKEVSIITSVGQISSCPIDFSATLPPVVNDELIMMIPAQPCKGRRSLKLSQAKFLNPNSLTSKLSQQCNKRIFEKGLN